MTAGKQITNTRILISKIPKGVAASESHFRSETVSEDAPISTMSSLGARTTPWSLASRFPESLTRAMKSFLWGSLVFVPSTWETYGEVVHLLLVLAIIHAFLIDRTLDQLAGQLAKCKGRKGLHVIDSTGSDEKVAFLKNEPGLDCAINYRTQDKRAALTELVGGAGLDIYYDLVGDEITGIVLDLLNPHGRVLAVGALTSRQNAEPYAPKNLINILFKQLRSHEPVLGGDDAKSELKYTDTVLKQDIESLDETYVKLLGGAFKGKM
ncbi:hypothetical protein BG011_000509 [Mortierella polycephala]|uniref:Alcohol dehydrogenase-like C-terminal domain-containing protein n=1 Tax=Mortierella polycephala TaxID=41804 RepID=A0A9P6QAX9_9FUNG|nr:hypothetical protein BG011_000509 [Mortierella polycephala]